MINGTGFIFLNVINKFRESSMCPGLTSSLFFGFHFGNQSKAKKQIFLAGRSKVQIDIGNF